MTAKSNPIPLMKRFELNKAATLRRLDELDNEMDAALDRGEVPPLASQDPQYVALRREFDDLERELDRRNLKRMASSQVAIYGGEQGKTVTSVAALVGARAKKRPKRKPKAKRRIRL